MENVIDGDLTPVANVPPKDDPPPKEAVPNIEKRKKKAARKTQHKQDRAKIPKRQKNFNFNK